MNNLLDRLQQAWQSQCSKPIDVKPDQLLKTARFELMLARLERWAIVVTDTFVILGLLVPGIWMSGFVFRDIQKTWPFLIYVACITGVVGFMLFSHWRRRRHAPRYDAPMLAHVEWAIKDIDYRTWQDRHTFWWYILPLALGCVIPTVITVGMAFFTMPDRGFLAALSLIGELLLTLGIFAAVFAFVHWVISRVQRMRPVIAARRRQRDALRALRESLLNPEEPHE